MACQGSLASFLKPPLQDNDRRAEESSNPDGRDVSALGCRIRRIAPHAEAFSPRLRYWEGSWLVVEASVGTLRAPSVIPNLTISFHLRLASSRLQFRRRC